MSGLCGWFRGKAAGAGGRDVISTMAAAITRFGGGEARVVDADCGAVAASAIVADVDVYQGDSRLVAVWGSAGFDDAELAAVCAQHGAAHALATAYGRHGKAAIRLLKGNFAIAILDHAADQALLAIDRMGTRSLSYGVIDGALVFGSTLDAIRAFPGGHLEINTQAIYDYVYFHVVPAPRTIHTAIRRLLPGEYVSYSRGSAKSERYWEMQFTEDIRLPFPELKQKFLAALRDGVKHAINGGAVGTFLSGGTDSSTIAGLLGQVTNAPARTYSIGFEAEGFDEMAYARIAARHFGTQHHEYYVTPDDVVRAIPEIAACFDQPFGNSSAVPTYFCARLAKNDGVQTLLGGDGGDELFGGNTRYAKQHLYSLYSDLPGFLRKGLMEPIAFALPEVSLIGQAQRYMRNAMQPMPARYDNYNLLERLGAGNIFTQSFLGSVDTHAPREQMSSIYQQAHAGTLINRMLALDFKYTLADNDLPKVTGACELAGVNVRFPMLDDAVVEFSGKLAPRLKLKGTRLRYFFKEALRDFLPNEIITKTKHGFGLPFGTWLQSHPPLQQIALDSLADLKKRNIIRPAFIDDLTSTQMQSHADYYGAMVWVLMMLEQWFKQRRITATAER